jgi:DNA-binding PadR family transcriptional regulator
MVASSWVLSDNGPAKRSYALTAAGETCLRQWITTLAHYRAGISSLLQASRRAVADESLRLENARTVRASCRTE